SCI
ncbi:putative serine protease do-like domain protein, partial [Chlamydia psittaci 84-8471/1]